MTYDVKLAKAIGYENVLFIGKTKSGLIARDNDIQQLNAFENQSELTQVPKG